MSAPHLYVHLPFCAHRCGYCDFVTAVGGSPRHDAYVEGLLTELALERGELAPALETIFLGGGTPSFTAPAALERLLSQLPPAAELTVEVNPETMTAELAALLRRGGVNRVSLGVQSFQRRLLEVLDRLAGPDDARRAVGLLRDAGFDNVSLDLIYGIPGQSPDDLEHDLHEALALEPEHLSAYELEAKPGTRFTHLHGTELAAQARVLESHIELVVELLVAGGYRWYETANFCRRETGRDLRSRHNLGIWLGHDYLGLGVGAVSTLGERRRRNAPSIERYLAALAGGEPPPRELEPVPRSVRETERLMLGLRLDEPLPLAEVAGALDEHELARLVGLGLARRGKDSLTLTRRGRFLGDAVTVSLLASA
jgi:oxygen-independent coproporphyrinogen-3 oxidase